MKKFSLLLVLVVFTTYFSKAQNTISTSRPHQTIFAELGGQGLTFTFNYDTRLSNRPDGPGIRVGIGYMKLDEASVTTIPIGFNYLLGKGGNYLEMGIGTTFGNAEIFDEESGFHAIGTMTFGYRRQPLDGGFNFRIGLNPIFGFQGGGFFFPYYPGISVGYTF